MPETTAPYRRVRARKEPTSPDLLLLLTVPCIPIGTAARLDKWSTWSVFAITFCVGLLYVGSLLGFGEFWSIDQSLFESTHALLTLLFAWFAFTVGPTLSVLGVATAWFLREVGCGVGESDQSCDTLNPVWVIGWVLLNLTIFVIALGLRSSLRARYKAEPVGGCKTCIAVMCVPLCSLASAMQSTRVAQAREDDQAELPAYTA